MDPTAMEELLDETRLLFHSAVSLGEELHRGAVFSIGMRAVLESLLRDGPTTVPGIARRRGVSRQHIQGLVNDLLESDLVELRDNPAHRRSPVVALSPKGERTIRVAREKETRYFGKTRLRVTARDLRRAADTLREVRRGLEGSGT